MQGRNLLRLIARILLIIAFVSQLLAFVPRSRLPETFYTVLLGIGLAIFVPSLFQRARSEDRPFNLRSVRRIGYLLVGLDWLAFSLILLLLSYSDPRNVDAKNLSRPFAIWKVRGATYQSFFLAWKASLAMLFFSAAALHSHTERLQPMVEHAGYSLPKLLQWRVLVLIFAPPILIFMLAQVLIAPGAGYAVIDVSFLWIVLGLVAVGIAVIVSGIRT